MLEWTYANYSFEGDLQLIHADVKVAWNGETWVEEPLCIDVGLPALVASLTRNVQPDRFADPAEAWIRMPFLVCGCGDPECRAFSFSVEHLSAQEIRLALLEERPGRAPRELEQAVIPLTDYRECVLKIAGEFAAFVESVPYQPLLRDTEELVRSMSREIKDASARKK